MCLCLLLLLSLGVMVTTKLLERSIMGWEQLCDLIRCERRHFTTQYSRHSTQPAPLPYITAKLREQPASDDHPNMFTIFSSWCLKLILMWLEGLLQSVNVRNSAGTIWQLSQMLIHQPPPDEWWRVARSPACCCLVVCDDWANSLNVVLFLPSEISCVQFITQTNVKEMNHKY